MVGEGGNDTYIVDHRHDRPFEWANQGRDEVVTGITFILHDSVEWLTLTGSANINGFGNAGENRLLGNAGANLLDGNASGDYMAGGAGSDRYVVDNRYDRAVEAAGQGNDEVLASISFGIGDHVEWLTLTGSANINGTGNAGENRILGNSGANLLDGGGAGDYMAGGAGNDTYVVDNRYDRVVEAAGQGNDTVRSALSFSLGADVENLVLTGTATIDGAGNDLANALTGNLAANALFGGAGNDTINGNGGNDQIHGGAGNDTLIGGGGGASFYFDSPLNASTNVDRIVDFSVAENAFLLSRAVFTGIAGTGTLAANAFVVGTAAQDAADRIIYDAATGSVFYDADGTGAGAAILFARVYPNLALTNADFIAF